MPFDQSEFNIRCEWGEQGVLHLAPISDVIIIVDVLSFSTCVEIATNNGAIIYPFRFKDSSSEEFAKSIGAFVAGKRKSNGYSLSPKSLLNISRDVKLVLPSPNGSVLTMLTNQTTTLAGCLRNAEAVAKQSILIGKNIGIIPAGERWPNNGLRPCIEDFIGAGAIISKLEGTLSPESKMALSVFNSSRNDLGEIINDCSSGKELIDAGFKEDVKLSIELNCSSCIPLYSNGYYINSQMRV